MATVRILVGGIRAEGRHGANPGERLSTQEFVVDLDVVVDLDLESDSLDETVDYRVLADAAREAVAVNSFELLETLAREVARAVYRLQAVERVTAVVHKPGAARELGLDDVAVEASVG